MPFTNEEANFFRIIKILGEYGSRHLRLLFKKFWKDTKLYNSFQDFLDGKKCAILHLTPRKECCLCQGVTRASSTGPSILNEYQRLTLYETKRQQCQKKKIFCVCRYGAKQNISEEVMDISLCCALLLNLFNSVLDPACRKDIENLRDSRNKYFHGITLKIQNDAFEYQWKEISGQILSIAVKVDPTCQSTVQLEFDNAKRDSLDQKSLQKAVDIIKEYNRTSAEEVCTDLIDVSMIHIKFKHRTLITHLMFESIEAHIFTAIIVFISGSKRTANWMRRIYSQLKSFEFPKCNRTVW